MFLHPKLENFWDCKNKLLIQVNFLRKFMGDYSNFIRKYEYNKFPYISILLFTSSTKQKQPVQAVPRTSSTPDCNSWDNSKLCKHLFYKYDHISDNSFQHRRVDYWPLGW